MNEVILFLCFQMIVITSQICDDEIKEMRDILKQQQQSL